MASENKCAKISVPQEEADKPIASTSAQLTSTDPIITPGSILHTVSDHELNITSGPQSRAASPNSIQSNTTEYKVSTQMAKLKIMMEVYTLLHTMDFEAVEEVEGQITLLQETWASFQQDHEQLGLACKKTFFEHPYMKDRIFEEAFRTYHHALSLLHKARSKLIRGATTVPAQPLAPIARHRSMLPEIKLPQFNGAFSAGPAFRDLFTSLVLNDEQLTNVEKLHYLRTSLTGVAAQLISNLLISNESFVSAWEIITERFNDKERIIFSNLDRLLTNLTPVTKTAEDLNTLLSSTKETVDSLKALDIPVEEWNYVLLFVVTKRLDPTLREAWEVKRSSLGSPTKYSQLIAFLQSRARVLEAVQAEAAEEKNQAQIKQKEVPRTSSTQVRPSQRTYAHQVSVQPPSTSSAMPRRTEQPSASATRRPDPAPTTSSAFRRTDPISATSQRADQQMSVSSTQYPCDLCRRAHYIVAYPRFKDMTVPERRKVVDNQRLCYNCLGHHNLASCYSSRTCKTCGGNHHTMTHLPSTGSSGSSTQRPGSGAGRTGSSSSRY